MREFYLINEMCGKVTNSNFTELCLHIIKIILLAKHFARDLKM